MRTGATASTDLRRAIDACARRPASILIDDQPWVAQSLTRGAAGIALLHIERAHAGQGTWQQAHTWIKRAITGEVSASNNAGLYQGAPAVALMLHAAAGTSERYRGALTVLDAHVRRLAFRRADAGITRIARGAAPNFREYDVFFGLTGLGALLLRREPGGAALEHVLRYLVALTKPRLNDRSWLPGWWVNHAPHHDASEQYPHGHGNFGVAHGIAGPLTLLSHALRVGAEVDGQRQAVVELCGWFDQWQQSGDAGPWWPEWITIEDLHVGRPSQTRAGRPSWCYGNPGIARALQSAAVATGDRRRQQAAEAALARCLADPDQLARVTDAGLCHGWAGLYQTVWRAARDSGSRELGASLPEIADRLISHVRHDAASDAGLLEGSAGSALSLMTADRNVVPTSGWDACLLLAP